MGSLTSDLDILQGPVTSRAAPAIGQAITPLAPNRTVFVSASMTASVLISLGLVRAVIEVSSDGANWVEADAGHSSAGVINFLRVLDGHSKLGAFVRPGQMYRFGGTGQGLGGSFAVQDLYETTVEVSSHRSVGFEYLSGAVAAPDNSHVHECGGPCFSFGLYIDQYKRDISEQYRDFDLGDPPKAYVRADENGAGGTGGPFTASLDITNPNAESDLDGWVAENTANWVAHPATASGADTQSPEVSGPPAPFFRQENPAAASNYLTQAIDLTVYAPAISLNGGQVTFTAQHAPAFNQTLGDDGGLGVRFLDGQSNIIGADIFGTPSAHGVNNNWVEISVTAPIPLNAQSVVVMLVDVAQSGGGNYSYYDEIRGSADLDSTGVGGSSTNNLHVIGRKASEGSSTFELIWRGVTYAEINAELTFPTPTSWVFKGDPGLEVGPPGEVMTVRQVGQPDQQVEICIDRTAPLVSLDYSGMTFGTDGLSPMRRGEYAKLLPLYSDAGVGVVSAALVYENGAYWVGEPTSALTSGVPTIYFRSSSGAPTSGSTDVTLVVQDEAGNIGEDSVTIFFGALPAVPAVTLSAFTGAQRPAHLNHSDYAETAYDDNAIGATVNIAPMIGACRNSGRDDTRSQLISGGLLVGTNTNNDVANQAPLVHVTTVSNQAAKFGVGIVGRVRDQHYRDSDSIEGGDYAFNASRNDDFGQDQIVGIGGPPFTGKAAEPFTDEYAGDVLNNCRIFDGAVEWLADGAVVELTVQLASNSGQLFQPRLFDKAGSELLYATYSAQVDVQLHDGTGFVAPASGDSFGPNASYDLPAQNGASTLRARVAVSDQAVPSLGAFILNYKA